MNTSGINNEVDRQRPHGDLPMGLRPSPSSLPIGEPETQPERVQDHEQHPEAVDQDSVTHRTELSYRSILTSSPIHQAGRHDGRPRALLPVRRLTKRVAWIKERHGQPEPAKDVGTDDAALATRCQQVTRAEGRGMVHPACGPSAAPGGRATRTASRRRPSRLSPRP